MFEIGIQSVIRTFLYIQWLKELLKHLIQTSIPTNLSHWSFQMRFLLSKGAQPSINQPGNSALACVLRHVKDWEFRYELLNMLLQEGGNPNNVGRDGSVPLMVCLVPLINKDPLHHLTHTMKVCVQSFLLFFHHFKENIWAHKNF